MTSFLSQQNFYWSSNIESHNHSKFDGKIQTVYLVPYIKEGHVKNYSIQWVYLLK